MLFRGYHFLPELGRIDQWSEGTASAAFDPASRTMTSIQGMKTNWIGEKALLKWGSKLSSTIPGEFSSIDDGSMFREGGKTFSDFINTMETNFMFLTLMEHGDSGGSLYCRKGASSPYVLVGVNQAVGTVLRLNASRSRLENLYRIHQ